MSRAASLVHKGYRLTPLDGKRPVRPNWPDQPLTLADAQQHGGNVGVILGAEVGAGVIAVDVEGQAKDPEGMKTLAAWRERFPQVFDRPTQSTPSGGAHFLFRLANGDTGEGLPNRRAAPGVDVLTHRKQVVAYTDQLPPRDTLPILPAGVREYLASLGSGQRVAPNAAPDTAPSFELIEKAVQAISNTPDTSRDEWVRMALMIKGACGFEYEDRGLELFQTWSAAYGEGNSPEENERVYLTGRPKAGWHALRELADKRGLSLRLEETLAAFAAEPLPAGAYSEDSDDPWVCVADALANPDSLKPPPAVIPRLAFAGRVTLLAAPEKSGKSTLVGQGVAALTSGAAFLDDPLSPMTTLWICIDEHPDDLVRRLGRYRVDGTRVHFTTRLLKAEEIVAKVRTTGARLCVVDTLTEWITRQGGDPNREADVLKVIRFLRDVARATGCAFLLLHHTVRDGSRYAGSHQIGASVDLLIEMKRRETRREFKPLGRFPVAPFALAFDTGSELYRLADAAPSLDSVVLEAIRVAPGLSMSQVQQTVGRRREDVTAAVLRLIEAGRVQNRAPEGRWKLHPVNLGDVFVGADEESQGVA